MKRFFTLFGIFALIFAACENESPAPNEELTPEITVSPSGIVTMPAVGGEVELNFQIINPSEGAKLEATADSEWITNLSVDEKVRFSVERNHSDQQRIGIVTLSYPNAEALSIAIQQNEALASGDVRISITSERKTIFEAEGGKGKVSYMLETDDEGAMPEVEADVEWITIDNISSDKVEYSVARSLSEERRVGHITLSYSGKSAEATIEQKAAELLPVLTANATSIRCGESITFSVSYAEEDVTEEAVIYDYYTKSEVENPYTPAEPAERVFYATYNNRTSKVLTVNVIPEYTPELPADPQPESYDFNQRMLIVDHTGVGCGYCPNMKSALKALEENSDYAHKFNIVYAYSFSSNEKCYSSASTTLWQYYEGVCSTSYMPLTGYPSATFNFCRNFAAAPGHMESKVDEYWVENPTASVALAATINEGKYVVNVEVKSAVAQNIHIALWALEDGIYAKQSGGSAEWMNNHHSVLRDALTGVSKSDISGIDFGYMQANTAKSKVLEFELFEATAWNSDNFKLIAIISSPNEEFDNRYEVINSAMCEIDSAKAHEYKTR